LHHDIAALLQAMQLGPQLFNLRRVLEVQKQPVVAKA
jgi:hypothetical protein